MVHHRTSEDDGLGWTQPPKQNAKYLGSMKPFSEGEPGSLGLYFLNLDSLVILGYTSLTKPSICQKVFFFGLFSGP